MTDKLDIGLAAVMQGEAANPVIGGIGTIVTSGTGAAMVAGDSGIASGMASAGIGRKNNEAAGTGSVTVGGRR